MKGKIVSLLRHAKSSWDDPSLSDRARPLNPRGRRAAQRMASHLARHGGVAEKVLCSPAERTLETLAFLRPHLPSETEVQIDKRIYEASRGDLTDLMRGLEDRWHHVLVIGHNPGIEELACWLTTPGRGMEEERMRRKFPTATLARLRLSASRWRDLSARSAELVEFTRPKDLR